MDTFDTPPQSLPIPSNQLQSARNILKQIFGYDDFRLHQETIINAVIERKNVLTLMPTGGGKSLCYQIPSLLLEGTGVVISPLIALMQDQVDTLKQLGIRAAYLNSTLDAKISAQTEQALLDGKIDLIYIAPERLLTSRTMQLLDRCRLALFAIDEAHCVSQWGHDFRRDYQQLNILKERYPYTPRIALTATADQRTREEIISHLSIDTDAVYINSFDRPNICYAINDGQNPRDKMWQFIKHQHAGHSGIVYCLSRKKVEATADWLCAKGCDALPYHAGLPADTRQQNQKRFIREDGVIIVATIAFGMGIDKPDVRFVAHLSLPKSIEAYYQETGRAGRDGEPANAWLGYGLQDVIMLRQMLQDSDGNEQFKRSVQQKLEAMLGLCELTSCRRQSLLAYFGETLDKPCGKCDNCLTPPETWDATVTVQKAISCVYRSGQRFGVNYIIDVLTGKDDERIQSNGHHKLSTFGIGTKYTATEWRSIFRQLITLSFLQADPEAFGALKLTEKCRPLLRGESTLSLRKQTKQNIEKQPKEIQTPRSFDEDLYNALRELRRTIADTQGVPAYIIFHDQTLHSMAAIRPKTLADMRYISGIGEQKLTRYGQEFLDVINQHSLPPTLDSKLSDTIKESLFLHSQGKDAESIAEQRELKLTTIYGHFAEAINLELLKLEDVIQLSETQLQEITTAIELLYDANEPKLKPIFDALDGSYDYGILRCVLANIHPVS